MLANDLQKKQVLWFCRLCFEPSRLPFGLKSLCALNWKFCMSGKPNVESNSTTTRFDYTQIYVYNLYRKFRATQLLLLEINKIFLAIELRLRTQSTHISLENGLFKGNVRSYFTFEMKNVNISLSGLLLFKTY